MRAAAPTALAAATLLAGCGGSHPAASPATTSAKPATSTTARQAAAPSTPAQRILGLPPVTPGPVPGYVLIADRNNNRILIVSPLETRRLAASRAPATSAPGQSFHDPDDAFFTPGLHGGSRRTRSSTSTMGQITLRTHRIVWSYGHPGVRGLGRRATSPTPTTPTCSRTGSSRSPTSRTAACSSSTGAHRIVREIGHAGNCGHNPPQGLSLPERRHAAAGRRRARDRDRRLGRPDRRAADASSTRSARRPPTRRTRSCCRTGTSSSPASTRPAASTRSRRRAGRVDVRAAPGPARSTGRRSPCAGRTG